MQTHPNRKLILAGGAALALALLAAWLFLAPFSGGGEPAYVYIDRNDDADSVRAKLKAVAPRQMLGMRLLMGLGGYGTRVRTGRYEAGPSVSTLRLFRDLRSGRQAAVRLTLPPARTMTQLAARLSKVLEADSATLAEAFSDEALCRRFGLDTATLPCIFLPNTYEVYWDITPEQLVARMQKESRAFWTGERRKKAAEAGLNEREVVTLASIVEQETTDDAEKPAVAGMYINRLRAGMKLQADPTVKFALRRFDLRRILHEHLATDSPYNTYRHAGLPPGPICLPSLASIEAVLGYARHDYLYMCANEDFSGTHRFAATYEEHMRNARRYAAALDARGIR